MISRLTRLTMENFRAFHGLADVALGGDVVLLYGENGTGKSSIMAGIEFGLTGRVAELARLREDYPRCLRHVDAAGPVSCRVECQSFGGDTIVFIAGGDEEVHLPTAAARHFEERCYLSQYQLTRLVGLYTQKDSESSSETLVAFVRELLFLDSLEALHEGLHEAGDIRRLRRAVRSYDQLRSELDELDSEVGVARTQVPRLREDFREEVRGVVLALDAVGLTAAETPDSIELLEAVATRLQQESQSDSALRHRANLSKIRDVVTRATALLGGSPSQPGLEAIEDRLGRLRTRLSELNALLAPVAKQGRSALRVVADEVPTTPGEDLTGLISMAVEEHTSATGALNSLERRAAHMESLRKRETDLSTQLATLDRALPERAAGLNAQVQLLRAAQELADGNICPVCDRDYQELGTSSLREHLDSRLADIERVAASITLDLRRRDALEKELREIQGELADWGDDQASRLAQARQEVAEVAGFLELARAAGEALDEWTSLRKDIEAEEEALALTRRRIASQLEVTSELRVAANSVGVSERDDPRVLLEDMRKWLVKSEDASRAQGQAVVEARETVRGALVCGRRLQAAEHRLALLQGRQKALQSADREVRQVAAYSRTLRDSAAQVKARLVEEVFSSGLNRLWTDLFSRLAKYEVFIPHVDVSVQSRGQIRAQIRALHEQGRQPPFFHLRSVLSAGNVNTAALSLFLSLNLVQTPTNQVIVLDDPIQSMDDVHAMEFASLLRLVTNQLNRQVVVAVHERAMFDYLLTELAPAEPGRSLVTVELDRSDGKTAISSQRREWSPDVLAVGG